MQSEHEPPLAPLKYTPAVEHEEPDEAATTHELIETMRKISETTFADGGHALRSVHAKSHALLRGEIEISANLPPVLAQGLFARPGRYPVIMRISTIPGDILDDSVSVPRGLSLKICDVPGERLQGSESDTTQDFVLVNGPAFAAPTGKAFLKNLKLLAATTDKAEGLKKVLSATLRGLESIVESFGGESATLKQLGGQPATNALGETYYSQAPVRYGDYLAKVALAPVAPQLKALTDAAVAVAGRPNALREEAQNFFETQDGAWELRVQLCTDIETMPVEDSSVPWPEDVSPYLVVARIVMPAQTAWSEALSREIDDGLSFSPWHGLAAHRPLGSIMRMRKPAYEMSADFRAAKNGCPIHEPRSVGSEAGRPK